MENKTELNRLFFALSDERRRDILEELSENKRTVGELADNLNMSDSAISKHISLLENAGLLFKSKQGRTVFCHMNLDAWRVITAYIGMHTRFWNARLDELEKFLE